MIASCKLYHVNILAIRLFECSVSRLREDSGLRPEPGEYILPIAIKYDVLQARSVRRAMLSEYFNTFNRTVSSSDKEAYPCLKVFQPPNWTDFNLAPSNMPQELYPLGFSYWRWRDEPSRRFMDPFCFEMPPSPLRNYFGLRCCYDPDTYQLLNGWPTRILLGGETEWSTVEEVEAEELQYKDNLPNFRTTTTTTTTPGDFIILFDGIETALSVFAGKAEVAWGSASLNFTSDGQANETNSSFFTRYILLSSEEEELLENFTESLEEALKDGENVSLENRSVGGVRVSDLGHEAGRVQIEFQPKSTHFLLVLAIVEMNMSYLSTNRESINLTISSQDPVLANGVELLEVRATEKLDTWRRAHRSNMKQHEAHRSNRTQIDPNFVFSILSYFVVILSFWLFISRAGFAWTTSM